MAHVKTYVSKEEFLVELAKHSDKIDVEASVKLPFYCIQDKEGKQYPASKGLVMLSLVNSICGKFIDLSKSRVFKKRLLSVAWLDSMVEREVRAKEEEEVVATPKAPAKKSAPAKKAKKSATKKPAAKK